MPTVTTADEHEVVVHELGGSASSPPLLFLHANGFHAHCYLPVAELLSDSFHCLGVDLRGHGATVPSQPVESVYDFFISDLLCILESLQLTGCYVFGHSLGGTLALLAELRHPGLFAALYLYEPPVNVVQGLSGPTVVDGAQRLGSLSAKRRRKFASREEMQTSLGSKQPYNNFDPRCMRLYCQYGARETAGGGVELCCLPEVEASVFFKNGAAATEVAAALDRVTCPVTIACGQYTGPETFLANVAPCVASGLPAGRLERYEALGHLGPMEDPALVARQTALTLRAARDPRLWRALPSATSLHDIGASATHAHQQPYARL